MSVGMVHVVHHSLWASRSSAYRSRNGGWWCVFCEGQEAIVQEAINLSTRSAIGYTETDHSQANHYVVRVQAMDGCDAMISGPEGQFRI